MIRKISAFSLLIFAIAGCTASMQTRSAESAFENKITNSLVYIDVTRNDYSQTQPWKRSGITQDHGFGCAVSNYEILTSARNIAGAEYIKLKTPRQTEYIQAEVKFIDYESDLCLLSIENADNRIELAPLKFYDDFVKNAELTSYWISPNGTLLTGRGYLESAKIRKSLLSYAERLNYIVTNSSSDGSSAKLFCMKDKPVGIASFSTSESKTVGLIPAVTINNFLADCKDDDYTGTGSVGFVAHRLIDPALRRYLKLDDTITGGMLVNSVENLGTGSDCIKQNDVILAIDGYPINPYGRYNDPRFGQIMYQNLIGSKSAGQTVNMVIFRDGTEMSIDAAVKNFRPDEMLIPYYEYNQQPEFIVTGGFVFQKMTLPYLSAYGDDISAAIPPHLYNYYDQQAFKPTEKRRDIVLLSFVLPHDINQGYHGMRLAIVDTFNGIKISQISDIIRAQQLSADDRFDVVTFEQDYPTVVIDRAALKAADAQIAQIYGVTKMVNINE